MKNSPMNRLLACLIAVLLTLTPVSPVQNSAQAQEPLPPGAQADLNAGTLFLSIPAAAFYSNFDNWENHGRYLLLNRQYGDGAESARAYAPVQLPHGATILRMSACLIDHESAKDVTLKLYHYSGSSSRVELATVSTSGTPGMWTGEDATITDPLVIPFYRYYTLMLAAPMWTTPGSYSGLCGVTIEYTPPAAPELYTSIPATAFRPMAGNGSHSMTETEIEGWSYLPATPFGGDFIAPVNLPHGTTITGFGLTSQENDPATSITAYLQRSPRASPDSYSNMAQVTSPNCPSACGETDATVVNGTIDNSQYMYWVYVHLPSATAQETPYLHGVTLILNPSPGGSSGQISMPTAAFSSFYYDQYEYENHARWLFHLHGRNGSAERGIYVAPVNLPDGVIITNFAAVIYDNNSNDSGSAYLVRTRLGVNQDIASVSSPISGSGGYFANNDVSLTNTLVDNSQYAYFVYYDLPVSDSPAPPGAGDVLGVSLHIEYVAAQKIFLPLLLKE
jgi:hypothetical protein